MRILREAGERKSILDTINTLLMAKKGSYLLFKICLGIVIFNIIGDIISYSINTQIFIIQNK